MKFKNSPRKAKTKVRHFCFIKIICLRFLWAKLSIGFGAKWLPFMTVSSDSYFSIFWGMWLIYFFCAMQQVRQECQYSSGNFVLLRLSVFGTSYSNKLFQPYFAFSLRFHIFSFHTLYLDDYSNSRAIKQNFENFDQILFTITSS